MDRLRVPVAQQTAGEGDIGIVPPALLGPRLQQDGAQPEEDDLSQELVAVNDGRPGLPSPRLALPRVGLTRVRVDRRGDDGLGPCAADLDRDDGAAVLGRDAQAAGGGQRAVGHLVPVVRRGGALAPVDGRRGW